MMNNALVLDAAVALSAEMAAASAPVAHSRLNELYLRLYGRPVRPQESELLLSAFRSDGASRATAPSATEWERICRVLLAANEFISVN